MVDDKNQAPEPEPSSSMLTSKNSPGREDSDLFAMYTYV